ncbi:hypothetical protein [Kozakia baliensis]|uniref:Uncharacterized protein n=1 Tax=Kozakia baliensis TaxID=153496 RepID=A0A1D8USB6_9PROT|nr:hypothetical protein [Kozakia baliensis]AOX16539.1 hypothetical protein A0U89_04705 [Kozakia baliensis]GBR22933.1 hypothetical protein AA0488_0008 [Kozakia baliensis NRIC 0488]GEL65484.1 hypothetical protein KBA01_27700 [Kozakia baliensis]
MAIQRFGYSILIAAWLIIGGETAFLEARREMLPVMIFAVWGAFWLTMLAWLMWEAIPNNVET